MDGGIGGAKSANSQEQWSGRRYHGLWLLGGITVEINRELSGAVHTWNHQGKLLQGIAGSMVAQRGPGKLCTVFPETMVAWDLKGQWAQEIAKGNGCIGLPRGKVTRGC